MFTFAGLSRPGWLVVVTLSIFICGRCLASDVMTIDGDKCHLPFIYNGLEYNNCTDEDADQPWCGLTANVDQDNSTGFCQDADAENSTMVSETFDMEMTTADYSLPTNITLKDFGMGLPCALKFTAWWKAGLVQAFFPEIVQFDMYCMCYRMGCRAGAIYYEDDESKKEMDKQKEEILKSLHETAISDYFHSTLVRHSVLVAFFLLCFIVGFIGNVLLIAVIFRFMNRSSVTNTFILNMAVGDFLVIVISLPVQAFGSVWNDFTFKGAPPVCSIVQFVTYMSFLVSIFSMVVMGVERYLAICWPMKVAIINTTNRTRMLLVLIWLLSILLSLPIGIFASTHYQACVPPVELRMNEFEHLWISNAIYLPFVPITFMLPLLVMVVCYSLASHTLWKSIKVAKSMTGSGTNKKAEEDAAGNQAGEKGKGDKGSSDIKGRIQVIKMLIAVLVIFVVCWSPLMLHNFARQFRRIYAYPQWEKDLRMISKCLAVAQSALNPVFYAIFSMQFRKGFMRLLCPCRVKEARSTTSSGFSQTASTGVSSTSVAVPSSATA